MRIRFLALLALLPACTTVQTLDAISTRTAQPIVVDLQVAPAEAYGRVVSAFTAEGLNVEDADASAGQVTTAQEQGDVTVASGMAVATSTSYFWHRAQVIPHEGGSRVLLNTWVRSEVRSGANASRTEPGVVSESCPQLPVCAPHRTRLEAVAARLRTAR